MVESKFHSGAYGMNDPILVWGGGAIGGTMAAHWARAGLNVLIVDIEAEHVKACRTGGLKITGPVEAFDVTVPATVPDQLDGEFSRIVLAVTAQHTSCAVQTLAPHLTETGCVVSAQNGLNERVISKVIGEERTVGAFVNFGADWHSSGKILFGNRGAVVIGELDGTRRQRTDDIYKLMQVFEPDAVLTDNIWGYLWGKLAYGAMLIATALNNDSMADNFADPLRAPVWMGLGREVMGLALKRGVRPVGFNGFDPNAYVPQASVDESARSIGELAAFNRQSAKTHSGIWRDLAIRKRKTETDEQIGILSVLAREVNMDVPLIDCLVELIHDIESGHREASPATFSILLRRCG